MSRVVSVCIPVSGSFAVLLPLSSCTTGPLNGTPYSGASTVGATFSFQGFTNKQSEPI